jgi:unsaturated chondroitin disaccharide hydrolase
MAVSHALKTIADIVRPDGSTYHVVDYSTSGAILWRGTSQGYADWSTWARGQAWAINGFTIMYRYTSDPRMLAAARKVADYYLSRLGSGRVPNWDFDAPTLHKDSAAAAVAASALFELSGYVADPDRQRYLGAALEIVDELASPAYLSEGTSNQAILLHGSVSVSGRRRHRCGAQRRRPLFPRGPGSPEDRALIWSYSAMGASPSASPCASPGSRPSWDR